MPYSFFASPVEFYVFASMFIIFIISEAVIKVYSEINRQRSRTERKRKYFSSIYIIIIVVIVVLFIRSGFSASGHGVLNAAMLLRFPHVFYFLGIVFMLGGTVLRCVSVITLKRAFTVVVQTTDDQKLIKHGVYKLLRNPSYTGILLFVTGAALSLRSVAAAILAVIFFTIFFSVRIKVEEKALRERFGQEFDEYCTKTWKLIPFIW